MVVDVDRQHAVDRDDAEPVDQLRGVRDVRRAEDDRVGDALSVDPGAVAFEAAPDGDGVIATVGGDWVGAWPSRAALVADAVLSTRSAWDESDHVVRADLAGRVRGFLDECPACGGAVVDSEGTVDSCCWSVQVLARSCGACDARLVELERDREAFAPG